MFKKLLIMTLMTGAVVQSGAAQGLSQAKIRNLALAENGAALQAYLLPYFAKGKPLKNTDVFCWKGGYRTLERENEKTIVVSTVFGSKAKNGKMQFAETFGLSDAKMEWFKNVSQDLQSESATSAQCFFPQRSGFKKELVLTIDLSGSDSYEIHARKYGKYILTRQLNFRKGEKTLTSYGVYYLDLNVKKPQEGGKQNSARLF